MTRCKVSEVEVSLPNCRQCGAEMRGAIRTELLYENNSFVVIDLPAQVKPCIYPFARMDLGAGSTEMDSFTIVKLRVYNCNPPFINQGHTALQL